MYQNLCGVVFSMQTQIANGLVGIKFQWTQLIGKAVDLTCMLVAAHPHRRDFRPSTVNQVHHAATYNFSDKFGKAFRNSRGSIAVDDNM